jgi:hypothetical protein
LHWQSIRYKVLFFLRQSLRYWDNGWKTVERKQADHKGYLVFERVPRGALLMLKNCRWKGKTAERIFTYEKGDVKWE